MLLLSNLDTGHRSSKVFWWPGGEGELHIKGIMENGVVTLYEAGDYIPHNERNDRGYYNAHGATLEATDTVNRFTAGQGWMYVDYTDGDPDDAFNCWISSNLNGAYQPYLTDVDLLPEE